MCSSRLSPRLTHRKTDTPPNGTNGDGRATHDGTTTERHGETATAKRHDGTTGRRDGNGTANEKKSHGTNTGTENGTTDT